VQLLAGLDSDAVDLVQHLLVFNPLKRLTAAEALRHPFITRFFPAPFDDTVVTEEPVLAATSPLVPPPVPTADPAAAAPVPEKSSLVSEMPVEAVQEVAVQEAVVAEPVAEPAETAAVVRAADAGDD
jgi:serine/threonine protein kinase